MRSPVFRASSIISGFLLIPLLFSASPLYVNAEDAVPEISDRMDSAPPDQAQDSPASASISEFPTEGYEQSVTPVEAEEEPDFSEATAISNSSRNVFFTLESSKTAMYDLNTPSLKTLTVVHYPDAIDDSLTGSFGIALVPALLSQSTTILHFPNQQKLLLDGIPEPIVYQAASTNWPEFLDRQEEFLSGEELSIILAISYSTDGGATFSEIPPNPISSTNAIRVEHHSMIPNSIALGTEPLDLKLASTYQPLTINISFPMKLADNNITTGEFNGAVALMEEWKLVTSIYESISTVEVPITTILSSPQIHGIVRQVELPEGAGMDWNQGSSLSGQTVELLEESSNNVIATTVTDKNGEYAFSHIATTRRLQVRINNEDGLVFFADPNTDPGSYQQKNTVPVGGVTDMDRANQQLNGLFSMVANWLNNQYSHIPVNTDTVWKNNDIDESARISQDVNFMIVSKSASEAGNSKPDDNADNNTSIFTPGHNSPDTGDATIANDNTPDTIDVSNPNTSSPTIDNTSNPGDSIPATVDISDPGSNGTNSPSADNPNHPLQDSSPPSVIIEPVEIPTSSSELDEIPQTGDSDISWTYYASLMLLSIAVFFKLGRRK